MLKSASTSLFFFCFVSFARMLGGTHTSNTVAGYGINLPVAALFGFALQGFDPTVNTAEAARLKLDAGGTRISFVKNLKQPNEREVSVITATTVPKLEQRLTEQGEKISNLIARLDNLEKKGSKALGYETVALHGFNSWQSYRQESGDISFTDSNLTFTTTLEGVDSSSKGLILRGVQVDKYARYRLEVTGMRSSANEACLYINDITETVVWPGSCFYNAEIGTISNVFTPKTENANFGVLLRGSSIDDTIVITDYKLSKLNKLDYTGSESYTAGAFVPQHVFHICI